MSVRMSRLAGLAAGAIALAWAGAGAVAAEKVKIGTLKTTGSGPVYIAQERGYFAAEGLDSELVYFESAQPISVAATSGDIDIGYTGFSGGFYSLASQGALKIVGGGPSEAPGFHYQPFLVSNHAWDAGLRAFKDFAGHSFAVSQIGSPPHYALALLGMKYGFELKSMRILPLQSIPNVASAIVGGQADTAMVPGNVGAPLVERGEVKLLGYAGDETPYQLVGVFVAAKTADARHAMIAHVLAALRKAARDYHDAFADADGKRRDGPTAPAILAILGKYTGQPLAAVAHAIPYTDPEGRLDVTDVLRQVEWYKSQGAVKGAVGAEAMIDQRYVIPVATAAK
jgi:NitT/TauT family transport system substrate-binding protein